MDKLTMAHEWYMKHSESPSFMHTEVEQAWQYADAMQAEVDKRQGGVPEAILKASNSRGLDIEGMLHDIDDYFDQAECTKTPRMANNLLAQIYEQLSGEVKVPEMEAERHALRGECE